MEVPELTCLASPAGDQPAAAPGAPATPGGQALPHLTLGPVILPPEQGLAPAMFLKAMPIPLYHTVPPGGLQPRAPLVAGSLDGGGMPFILSPMLQPEGPGPPRAAKPAAPVLTLNIVGALPVLSPGLGPPLGSPGKGRSAGKHLCPHCGRDCLKPSVLEKHIRSHTGERPFPCPSCGIAFKTQSNLYKHRRTQTHLNNCRLPSESDGAGGSLLEEGGKAGETSRGAGKGDSWSPGGGDGARSEKQLSPGRQGAGRCPEPPTHVCPLAKSLDPRLEALPCPGSAFADRETPLDSTRPASPGLPPAGPQPRRKLPEQKSLAASRSCSLQQQQATSSEKAWEAKALESRLRKCESTDSGYLSRSDSVEQPLAPCSPLHSLSEHSAESEGDGVPGRGGARAGPGERGSSLELEKRQLEERIARLISHNRAVVEDPQLDNVRPRKTILSKQGSIDLPMPYTYKDSFHFEIRALEPGRRRPGALCATRSTCTPPDKARPLFFHSVPTQLSTTMECIPVTRSNSLPFVEGTRMWQEPSDSQDTCTRRQKALSPRPVPAQLVDAPSCHPRALVRQAAVEDLLCPPIGDAVAPAEDLVGHRTGVGEGVAGKGRTAGRKGSQRKLKMFSQEKWQVYGDETFKRIYQKVKTSHRGGKKAREVRVGSGAELDLPLQEEADGGQGRAPSQDGRTLVHGDTSVGAKPGPWESLPATETLLVTESPKQGEMMARAGGSDQTSANRAVSPPTINCGEPPSLGSKSPLLPPDGRRELGGQLSPVPGPLKGEGLEAPGPALPDPKLDGGDTRGGGGMEDTCQQVHTILRRPSGSPGEPQPTEDKLPSERKKLRVEGLGFQEQPGPLGEGGEPPGGPEQATFPPSRDQDSDPEDESGGLHQSADGMARPRDRPAGASGASSTALRLVGLRDKEPTLCPTALVPGCHAQLATQPGTPGILAAKADTAFPPKYLLKLPQGETHPTPPGAQGWVQGQDPLCGSGQPEEPAPFVGSGLGALLPPGPAPGLAPGGADSLGEDPSWSELGDRRNGVQGEEKGDLDSSPPAAGVSPGSAAGAPRKTASFLHTPTRGSWRGETRDTGKLCVGSAAATARPSDGVPSPWAPRREVRRPPETAPRDAPAERPPPARSPCCSLRSAPLPPGWPELALGTHSETPGSCGARGPFPSLRAEPRLTWCCLNRSLPRPTEQREATSVYLALHVPGGSCPDEGLDARLVSKAVSGGWTRTSPNQGGQAQASKLSCPTAPGMTSQDRGAEPEWKKGAPRRRGKASRGSSQPRKLSVSSRRYRGTFLLSHVQLKAGRLRKPLRVLRKDGHPPLHDGLDPHRTLGQSSSEMSGRNLQGEPLSATSDSPLGCGNKEKEEEGGRPTSRGVSPTSSRTFRETDMLTVKDLSPSADERGDSCPQNVAVGSVSSLPSDSRMVAASDSLLAHGKGLDTGLLGTQQPPSQEQDTADPRSCIFSDAQEPSFFASKGNSPHHDIATSAAAVCTSLGARAGHTMLGIQSVGPQDHGRAAGETLTQSSPDSKAVAEGMSTSLLARKPLPGRGISGPVPLRSPGKAHLEIPVSGPGSTSSHPEEGRLKTLFPSGGQYGCGETLVPCPPVGNDSEKCHVSGLIALKDCVVPSNPGQPTEIPEAPSKTIKKRSLEGMRKQTRVELSDTSSDDEDRLVIEI